MNILVLTKRTKIDVIRHISLEYNIPEVLLQPRPRQGPPKWAWRKLPGVEGKKWKEKGGYGRQARRILPKTCTGSALPEMRLPQESLAGYKACILLVV